MNNSKPPIKITDDMTDIQRESAIHFNALHAQLHWFAENGVAVNIQTQGGEMSIHLSAAVPARKKGASRKGAERK